MLLRHRFCRAALLGGFAFAAVPAQAGDVFTPVGVVELFTSQGCASCPRADDALERLIAEGKVVALAYHVDYWNYLGWADTLSTPENTARQYAYARMLGRNGVYTPQVVLNGREHANGADLPGINSRLKAMNETAKGMSVLVDVRISNGEINIAISPGKGKANVLIVYFNRQKRVDVRAGENGGRTIAYWHSVRDIQTIGMWDGRPVRFTLPATVLNQESDSGCAVLLQRMKTADTPGAILGATAVLTDAGR